MPRLFVAIDLPLQVKERLSLLCCGLPGARWVRPEHLHLTLRFIGEVDAMVFQAVRETLVEVQGEPFSLRLGGTGFFPPRGRPRVVWVGIGKNERLRQLRNRIESVLVRAGLEPDGRKFAPHITLARLKNTPSAKVGDFLSRHGFFVTEDFFINEFLLYSSVLSSKGAKHYIEEAYPLG
jgi:2'-5' RNA ligase